MESPSHTSATAGAAPCPQLLRRETEKPCCCTSAATSSKRWGWRGTISHCTEPAALFATKSGASCAGAAGARGIKRFKAARNSASSPSRALASITTGRPPAAHHARPCAICAVSGVASNFTLPKMPCTGAPNWRKRSASACDCAHTAASPPNAGRASQPTRSALRSEWALSRALANTSGTPCCWHTATMFGQTSVSMRMPMAGWNCARKRRTAPGVSHGCHTCMSPGCSSALPSARPVAVPWVSSRRMPGIWRRRARTRMAAAHVSPIDTACTQTQPLLAGVPAP